MIEGETKRARTGQLGVRRLNTGTCLSVDLRQALLREAGEAGVSLSAHIADVLAKHAGVAA